jgi:nitroreductase
LYALKQEKEFNRLASLLDEGNYWAKEAPALILSIAQVVSDYKNRPNAYAMHDLGMATANLMIQATSMGFYLHPMAGFDSEKAVDQYKIPENYKPGAMIALGYHGEIDHLPVELKRRELKKRTRKELKEFVFQGEFGKSAPKI